MIRSEHLLLHDNIYAVAGEQGFSLAEVPKNRQKHYLLATKSPLRCVDDRPVSILHQEYAYGPQIHGCTHGVAHALGKVAGLPEERSLRIVCMALKELGLPVSAHKQCGYLAKSEQGLFPHVTPLKVDERLKQIEELNGVILDLKGEHQPAQLLINLKPNHTFDTEQALQDNQPGLNLDLWMVPILAQTIHRQGLINFSTDALRNQVLRDFLTIGHSLSGSREAYLRL